MKRLAAILLTALLLAGCRGAGEDPAALVNPFIGASTNEYAAGVYHGLGKTFPGAATPFGMTQVSPNSITGGDNGSGYSYEHRTLEGFAFMQMSGVGWYGDLGNFLVMPTRGRALYTVAGKEDGTLEGWRSEKAAEAASAGYYSVLLSRYGIRAEATASPHGGILRFTYPADSCSRIQVDLARRVGGTSTQQYVEILDSRTIRGWMKCPLEGGGWGDGTGNADYTVHFYARSSKPFVRTGVWKADIPEDASRHNADVASLPYQKRVSEARIIPDPGAVMGDHIGFFGEFPTREGENVEWSVGISFVDLDGAENNWRSELEGKSFDALRREAGKAWTRELSRVRVQGGSPEERTVFYTALYHAMLDPRVYADVDGRYVGGDLDVYSSDGSFVKRTVFSGWDVFRSEMPLLCIIRPDVVGDLIQSLITLGEQSGRKVFDRWEFLNAFSGCMVGNPALPVITDAYRKGIRTFDARKALEMGLNTSREFGPSGTFFPGGQSISNTLEYAYADWCLSCLAADLGEAEVAEQLLERSGYWRNVFDPSVGWFRPRRADGSWYPWTEEDRMREGYGCVESNPWQQGWFVPHDVDGMVAAMGGREAVLADLGAFFEAAPEDMLWNQAYNHSNEPVHLVPFLFNRLGRPDLTQKWTREICRRAYHDGVEGLVGNEDVGQMSAWYVLAASGIHPACPGDPRMEITSPVFDRIDFALDSRFAGGKKFTVIAHDNAPGRPYIRRMALNGKPLAEPWIDASDIAAGSLLELWMSDSPE